LIEYILRTAEVEAGGGQGTAQRNAKLSVLANNF